MEVLLLDKVGNERSAEIVKVVRDDLKNLNEWKFDWISLFDQDDSTVYKLQSGEIEGLLMVEQIESEFFELKNIEVAPKNYGSQGHSTNVAQLLMSYACLLSFELNKGPYKGYVSFVSKGELIDYYIEKYNAELIFRERMIISPVNGLKLIKQHLKIEL